MTTIFKHADAMRITGASANQLDYWMQADRFLPPHKDAAASGDHRQFATLNVVEVAQAVVLAELLGMSTDRLKALFAAQRKRLNDIPPENRAVAAWTNYVRLVISLREQFGGTDHPTYRQWELDVARTLCRLDDKRLSQRTAEKKLGAPRHAPDRSPGPRQRHAALARWWKAPRCQPMIPGLPHRG